MIYETPQRHYLLLLSASYFVFVAAAHIAPVGIFTSVFNFTYNSSTDVLSMCREMNVDNILFV